MDTFTTPRKLAPRSRPFAAGGAILRRRSTCTKRKCAVAGLPGRAAMIEALLNELREQLARREAP